MTWSPTTAELRDNETRDESAHARRNLEQLKVGIESGDIDVDELSDETLDQIEDL